MLLEAKAGTYALILSCSTTGLLQVGRLAAIQLEPGYYVYLGSALGPGGLRARIAHHQKRTQHPHWHIDYLRLRASLHSVWFSYDVRRREHEWAHAIQTMPSAAAWVPGFGTSDVAVNRIFTFSRVAPWFVTSSAM
jgi:Uri superfamily endonuclease